MSIAMDIAERKDRPPYVRFERVAVEDKAATLKAGHYVAKDVDYALITPPYSKDVFKQKATDWLEANKQQVMNGRMPEAWQRDYEEAYKRWKNGQEIPLNGTPIKGWGVISPAQQETLIQMNCLTVEDLAAINDEGLKRIGMGAVELKHKAAAWLSQLHDKGPLTIEIAALKTENSNLKTSVDTLTQQVNSLMQMVQSQSQAQVQIPQDTIGIDDLIETEPARRGPGRPKKAEAQA